MALFTFLLHGTRMYLEEFQYTWMFHVRRYSRLWRLVTKIMANDQLGHFKYLTFIFFCFFTFVMSIDAEKKQVLDTGDDESANTCIYERRLTRYNSVI